MELLLLAFGWLAFIIAASLAIAYGIDWIQNRRIPFVQRMNAVSMMSSIEGQLRTLSRECMAMRVQIDAYERSWVSANSFCRLEEKVDHTLMVLHASMSSFQQRLKALEHQVKEETK